MATGPDALSNPDPRLVLRKLLRAEMEALHSLVEKAELLAGKNGNRNGGARPHRFGGRRFLEASRSCAKKRKTTPVAKIVEPVSTVRKDADDGAAPRRAREGRRSLGTKTRRESVQEEPKVAFIKKRIAMPPSEIVEPRTPRRVILRCVSSPSAKTPVWVPKEPAADVSRSPISRPSPRQIEEGEIVGDEEGDFVDIGGGASPVLPPVRPSSPVLLEAGKAGEVNVLVDVCGEASPVVPQKLADAEFSPRSSRSSGYSCGHTTDSGSSGSSSGDSSDSDNGVSGNDDVESVGSSPAPDFPHKVNTPLTMAAQNGVRSSPCVREGEELEEGECAGASPVAEAEAAFNSPRSSSRFADDDESVGSSPVPSFLPFPETDEVPKKPVEQRRTAAPSERPAAPAAQMSSLLARARARMQQLRREPKRQKAYEELEAMERNALPSDWIDPMDMIELGITAVEHLVTFERLVPGCGGPVQQWFGLSWKGE